MKKEKIEKMFEPTSPKERKIYKFKEFEFINPLFYFIAVPLYYILTVIYKIKLIYHNNIKWSEKRTIKILDDAIPKCFFKDKKIKKFYSYILPERKRWENQVKKIHRNYCRKYNKEITNYLLNSYELKGFTKEIKYYPDEYQGDEYEVSFLLN